MYSGSTPEAGKEVLLRFRRVAGDLRLAVRNTLRSTSLSAMSKVYMVEVRAIGES